jgi:hypothetical protein
MSMDETDLEHLLRLLAPAPETWVRTAQELPFVRDEVAAILERAASSSSFRDALRDDASGTLAREGVELNADVVAHILRKLPKSPD